VFRVRSCRPSLNPDPAPRQVKPRRADNATRITLVVLSRLVAGRRLLIVVKPDTLIRWHRKGFQLLWRWKSRPRGRPRLPADLQRLIADMATANRTWGEGRIAAELLVKLGIRVSPRTVRRYMPTGAPPRSGSRSQLWSTWRAISLWRSPSRSVRSISGTIDTPPRGDRYRH
jgi:putative transposase